MRNMDEGTFSHPASHPWSLLPGLALLMGWLLIWLIWVRPYPPNPVQWAAYWLVAGLLAVLVAWWAHLVLMAFTEPHAISVTRRGIAGRPIHGPVVEIEWGQIESVQEARTRFPRRRLEVTRIRAYGGRTLVFKEDLPGYNELKGIVSDRLGRARG